MEILRLCAIGILTAILAVFLKAQKGPWGLFVSLGGGCLLLFYALPYLRDTLSYLTTFAAESGLRTEYLGALFRVVSVAFITECASALCRDAGESALSVQLEMAGKLLILGISMPILTALFDTVVSVLP